MPAAYLQQADYAAFGLPASTTAAQVAQASALIDAYLYRPEGLLWAPDGAGMPCYMVGLAPIYSLTTTGAIAPGNNVSVPLVGPATALQVGDVLVLDRANPSLTEACVIGSISGNVAVLKNVLFSHTSAVVLEYGMVIEEQKTMPKGRPNTFVSRGPLLRIHAGIGRYAYGRRGESRNMQMDDFNLLAAVTQFGGAPLWELFSPLNTGFDANGQVWIPAGVLLAYYSEVKLRYVAGFQYANLPNVVKFACASLVQAIANQPAMGSVKTFKAGDTTVQKFTDSTFDDDTKQALNPYRAKLFG